MNRAIILLKSLFCKSTDETLNTFHEKTKQLRTRIDVICEHINSNDALIDTLYDEKQVLLAEVLQAETAIEHLEKITG